MSALEDWVRLDEALRVAGRSKPTIYRWVDRGLVRSLTTGRTRWFNLSDLRVARGIRRGRPEK